jgi:hypothetical protein
LYLLWCIPYWSQYTFPPAGKPPASPTDMPLPILYVMGGLALMGLIFGGSKPKKSKKSAWTVS